MKFTQITEKIPYPIRVKAQLSTYHANLISYVLTHFQNSKVFKLSAIDCINALSYMVITGDTIPNDFFDGNPIENTPQIEKDICKETIGNLYLDYKSVEWDIEESDAISAEIFLTSKKVPQKSNIPPKPAEPTIFSSSTTEELSLKPPRIPLLDYTKPWLNAEKDGEIYTIYTTLPIIPEVQRDISVTTDSSLMSRSDFLRLFPHNLVRTRSAAMYEPIDSLEFHRELGIIFPIAGFTKEQVQDNIIQYPHLYRLKRKCEDKLSNFYAKIEIDGKLYDTLSVWDSIPDTKWIPKTTEYIKEYVIRRYLLERDVLHIMHRYPLFGSLKPFVTLFATSKDYQQWGYSDSEDLARQCVLARVEYLQTRNPILRKVYDMDEKLYFQC